ncbi:hypothetical protein Q7P37_000386 [Cladosporium fusiforme]
MLSFYIATTLMIAGSAFAVDDAPQIVDITNSTSTTSAETSSKIVLTDFLGLEGPTAIPGSSSGVAIIGDKTYTAGGPAVTSAGNTINSILTDGVVYNNRTYTYTTTDTNTYLPSWIIGYTELENGTVVIRGHTLAPGDPAIVTEGHTVSAATDGLVIDGTPGPTRSTVPVQTVTFESETMTASEISSGVWDLYTETLTVGGDAKTLLYDEVTAASSGIIVASSTTSASTTSSTGAASRMTTACWAGLFVCGIGFSML